MRRTRSMFIAACATLALIAATATAQVPADRRTLVTFSGPVSIPGATLPAGTYTFKIADSPANRHIVQIFDRDESKIYATVLAVAAERAEAGGDPVITFKETPSDRPPAVHFWYYAGEKSGNELVYPKDQAMAIARASGESVMSIDCASTDMKDCKGDVSRISSDTTSTATSTSTASTASTTTGTSTATSTAMTTSAEPARPATTTSATTGTSTATSTTAPPTQPEPTQPEPATAPAPVTTAPAPTTAPSTAPVQSEPAPVGTSGRDELPRTASQLPLVGLIGLLSLSAALALRIARA